MFQYVKLISTLVQEDKMVKFELIPEGDKFGFRGEVWHKVLPFSNGRGGIVNAFKDDCSDAGSLQQDEMAKVDDITLVTKLEQ